VGAAAPAAVELVLGSGLTELLTQAAAGTLLKGIKIEIHHVLSPACGAVVW
jgi:hypothetical protein